MISTGLLCTFHHRGEPLCALPPQNQVHVSEDERMQRGKHVWRHDPKDEVRLEEQLVRDGVPAASSGPDDELLSRFQHHTPSEIGQQGMEQLRKEFILLVKTVDDVVPDGREKSLALTNLEQALFWANAGVARHG